MACLLIACAFLVQQSAAGGGNDTSQPAREGWVSSPNGRGTIDILWSCIFTVFICTWTSLHLNIPSLKENYWHQFFRKCRWMMQALMAPEFVFAFATGQKVDAKKSVEDFKKIGYPQWTVRHGFYANMGGFVVQPRDFTPFPINAKQLQYLVEKDYMSFPSLTEKEVWDKSKADGFQKLFTCLQTGWFIIQVVGRAIQHLPVTTLELTTLSFVFCNLAMYCQWANKPLDVEIPTIIKIEATTKDILLQAGNGASEPYRYTPLDFIDNQSPSWLTEVQPHLRFHRGPRQRPLPRFTNDRFPVIGASLDAIILFLVTIIYSSLHFIGWNFSFPTRIEQVLWRSSCIVIVGTTVVFLICETYQDGHRLGRWEKWYVRLFLSKDEKTRRVNTEELRRRQKRFVPVWEVLIMTPMTVLYTLARSYIVIEVFLSQRSLPIGAFDSPGPDYVGGSHNAEEWITPPQLWRKNGRRESYHACSQRLPRPSREVLEWFEDVDLDLIEVQDKGANQKRHQGKSTICAALSLWGHPRPTLHRSSGKHSGVLVTIINVLRRGEICQHWQPWR